MVQIGDVGGTRQRHRCFLPYNAIASSATNYVFRRFVIDDRQISRAFDSRATFIKRVDNSIPVSNSGTSLAAFRHVQFNGV